MDGAVAGRSALSRCNGRLLFGRLLRGHILPDANFSLTSNLLARSPSRSDRGTPHGAVPAGQLLVIYPQRIVRSAISLLCFVAATAATVSVAVQARDFADSLVRIQAVAADGSPSFGTGVVIAADLLGTACHVTRGATTIEVAHPAGGPHWKGSVQSGSLTHDLCLVSVPGIDLPAAAIRASGSLQLGERVFAAGFPAGGDLSIGDGHVEGLYPFDGGNVIRTSAKFEAGASGGGLFDAEGMLVGVLAFKARSGTKLHFALPADWALPNGTASSQLGAVAVSSEPSAFWEQPKATQPPFLGHALMEAASQR